MGHDNLLLRSLRRIHAHGDPSGIVKIRSPGGKHGHGDDASALVLALHAAQRRIGRGLARGAAERKAQVAVEQRGQAVVWIYLRQVFQLFVGIDVHNVDRYTLFSKHHTHAVGIMIPGVGKQRHG